MVLVKSKLKKLGVAAVYLFGSRAQGVERPQSDFDIGVLLNKPFLVQKDARDFYQCLYEIFSDYFKTMANIDIVFLQDVTGQLRYHVVKHGKVLFDIEPKLRKRFEDNTILEHADFEPHRRKLRKHLLSGIS